MYEKAPGFRPGPRLTRQCIPVLYEPTFRYFSFLSHSSSPEEIHMVSLTNSIQDDTGRYTIHTEAG